MRNGMALVFLLAACGGPQTTSEPPAAASTAEAEAQAATASAPGTPPPGFSTPWNDMSRKDRMQVMKTVVVPRVGAAFTEFDPEHFDHVDCTTCHGDGALEGNFDMPNPELPKLPFGAGWEAYVQEHQPMVTFMTDVVVPTTAEALGLPPYDPATEQGFGCLNCHMAAN